MAVEERTVKKIDEQYKEYEHMVHAKRIPKLRSIARARIRFHAESFTIYGRDITNTYCGVNKHMDRITGEGYLIDYHYVGKD